MLLRVLKIERGKRGVNVGLPGDQEPGKILLVERGAVVDKLPVVNARGKAPHISDGLFMPGGFRYLGTREGCTVYIPNNQSFLNNMQKTMGFAP